MKDAVVTSKEASITTKNLSTITLLKMAQYPFLVLTAMIIPRIMGPAVYGEYALLISILTMTASIIDFGGDTALFGRYVPEFETRGELGSISRLSSQMLSFKMMVDLLVCSILYAMLHFAFGDRFPAIYFVLIIATVTVRDFQSVPSALLFGLNKLWQFSLCDPVRRALSFVFILILFPYLGILGAILATFFVDVCIAALAYSWTKEYFHNKDFRVDLQFLKPYLLFCLTFYFAAGVLSLWQRMGNVLIQRITGDSKEVAFFDMANQMFLITTSFTIFLIGCLVPIFTKFMLSRRLDKLLNWSKLIIKYTTMLCVFIYGGYLFLGPDLIPIAIGREYGEIFPNGAIILLGMFPMILAQMGLVYSTVYKQPRKYLVSLCLGFGSFLAASLVLIPSYRSMGCAISVLFSSIVLATGMVVSFRKSLMPCLPDVIKTTALGFICIPFVYMKGGLTTNIGLTVGAFSTYIVLLFVTRVLSTYEIREIFQAIRHRPDGSLGSLP
jgi:O-antigen/teichoic acid export membrane protein